MEVSRSKFAADVALTSKRLASRGRAFYVGRVADLFLVRSSMRSLLIILGIALLETSLAGERTKFVIHPQEILTVCADDTEVEIVAWTTTAMPDGADGSSEIAFSFPIVPSGGVARDFYVSSMSYGAGVITLRFRFKDSRTAAAVAAFIDAQQTGGCNPPVPPQLDGPYA
jgi:hypothetical protein